MDWRDKVVVVTGASSGIGRATALELARRGAVVVAVARRERQLAELVAECQVDSPASEYLAGDLGERHFAESVIDGTAARHGRIHALVNNAGMPLHKHIFHTSADEVARVMDVNFMSCVWCTLAAIPYMLRDGGGSIVNVSSFGTRVPPPREAVYVASKAAMDGFTAGLWNELQGSNIHVALVTPGAIDTEIWDKQAEPNAYKGARAPAEGVAAAILEAIERRRREQVVPRRHLGLWAARVLRVLAPSLLRMGTQRMAPVPAELVAHARERARRGLRLGDPGDDGAAGGSLDSRGGQG